MHTLEVEGSNKEEKRGCGCGYSQSDNPDWELKPGGAMDYGRWMAEIKGYWCNGD